MLQTFKCPSCGASLDFGDDDPVVRCAYCDSTIVVPENLRARPQEQQQAAWTVTPLSGSALTLDIGGLAGKIAGLKAIKQLVREGRESEAARLFQDDFGTGAEEASEAVRRLASGQSVALSGTTVSTTIPVAFGKGIKITSSPQVAEALRQQMDLAQRGSRAIGRIITWVFIAVFVFMLALFALIFFLSTR